MPIFIRFFSYQKIFENFTVTSVKSSEHQNKNISHNHQVMFALELTAEFINSLMTHLNNSNFDFVRKSRNKKNMHLLESGFLCCNVFILYFYRFAWDLSCVQTSNAFGPKVSFSWQLHACYSNWNFYQLNVFYYFTFVFFLHFCLMEYDGLKYVLDIKTFIQNIFC